MSRVPSCETYEAWKARVYGSIANNLQGLTDRMLQYKEKRDEEGDLESVVIIKIEAIRSGEWFKCKECRRREVCTDHEIRLH